MHACMQLFLIDVNCLALLSATSLGSFLGSATFFLSMRFTAQVTRNLVILCCAVMLLGWS